MSTWLYRLGAALAVSAAVTGCEAPVQVADEAPPVESAEVQVAGQSQELQIFKNIQLSRKNTRIAIIGAGPSGLTAADTLQDLGYKKVTIFEKNDRVGGKVWSPNLGGNVAEMGAVFASSDYTLVLDLAKKHNIETAAYGGGQTIVDENNVRHTGEEFLTSRYSQGELLGAVATYGLAQALYVGSNLNGFAHQAPALDQTFDQFMAEPLDALANPEITVPGNIEPIAEATRSVMVGFGYGFYETAPAAYFWKLLPWLMKIGGPKGLTPAQYLTFPTGFQSVWTAVASDLDVRLNSEVTNVERKNNKVYVTVNHGAKQEFDYVIVSAPLNKVSDFMSLSSDEASLFPKVEGLRYFVSLFTAAGLPTGEATFFHGNSFPDRINHAQVWANRGEGAPFVGYQIADTNLTANQVTGVLAQDVASQGGTFGQVVFRQEWDNYFPHVSESDMKAGFYEAVEDLQGDNRTFYVGGTLSFETVEHSARYAKELVLKNFLLSWP
jgi:oxygen-dependent protoporphyrinogen oxidase